MSVARLLRQHPDDAFARRVLSALCAYALKSSDGNPAKLPVQVGSWGVGAEYQPNFYQFTEPKWRALCAFVATTGRSPSRSPIGHDGGASGTVLATTRKRFADGFWVNCLIVSRLENSEWH